MTLTAGALIGLLAFLGSPQDDKTFQPAIKKFQDDYYQVGAKDDEKIFAVNQLAQYRHERIVKVLAPLLTEATVPVRVMTARALSRFTGIEAAPRELLGALTAIANGGRKQTPVRIEVIRALAELRYKPAAPEVVKLVDDKEIWVAKAAIDACTRIRSADAMTPLLKSLKRIEGADGDAEISVNPLDDLIEGVNPGKLFKADPRQPKRPSERELLKGPIQAALQSITKQSMSSYKDWHDWWSKNRATFKVAD